MASTHGRTANCFHTWCIAFPCAYVCLGRDEDSQSSLMVMLNKQLSAETQSKWNEAFVRYEPANGPLPRHMSLPKSDGGLNAEPGGLFAEKAGLRLCCRLRSGPSASCLVSPAFETGGRARSHVWDGRQSSEPVSFETGGRARSRVWDGRQSWDGAAFETGGRVWDGRQSYGAAFETGGRARSRVWDGRQSSEPRLRREAELGAAFETGGRARSRWRSETPLLASPACGKRPWQEWTNGGEYQTAAFLCTFAEGFGFCWVSTAVSTVFLPLTGRWLTQITTNYNSGMQISISEHTLN